MIYRENIYLTISGGGENRDVVLDWHAAPSESSVLREGLDYGLSLIGDKQAGSLIMNWGRFDFRNLTTDDEQWIEYDWFVRLQATGLRNLIVIVPTESYSFKRLRDLFQKMENTTMVISYFNQISHGHAWLSRQNSLLPIPDNFKIIFRKPFVTVSWYEENRMIRSEWHREPDITEYKDVLGFIVEFVKRKRIVKWLSDARLLGGFSSAHQDWTKVLVIPVLMTAGLRYIAIVMPGENVKQKPLFRAISHSALGPNSVAYFETVEAAWSWLQSPQSFDTLQPVAEVSTRTMVGFSFAHLMEERWQRDRDFFIAKARELGMEVLVRDAAGDPDLQLQQCDEMLAKGVKVLIVVPLNSSSARPIVFNAHALGVKVISYDRLIDDVPVDLYLSFDNEKVGELQAKAIIDRVPKGDYLLLFGDPADKNSGMIRTGHFRILQPLIDKGDIKVVAERNCEKWLQSEAFGITEEVLKQHRVDAVIASNDDTAAGAIGALEDKGMAGKVPVSGQDAELIACRYIWRGIQTVTVYKPIKRLAEMAAEQAVKMAKSESAKLGDETLKNGGYDVPVFFIKPTAVTKENILETVVADGFHTAEDVTK